MKVKWTYLAGRELIGIRKYIGKNNPEAARQVALHIKASSKRLGENPLIGRVGRLTGTRELVMTKYPYILVYQVNKDRVEILRVMHTAQYWPE